ncbi:MAG: MBL fold metallo-hydrolase [Clostridia bacterium]|nr:MBL fold metallo-hydrolase [Clostridia bacterium]
MLKFIGTGSAFNTELGNTSAYIKEDKTLLLIDAGATAFARAKEIGLFDEIEHVYVIITHMHTDHVGSLGNVIEYCNIFKSVTPNLILTNDETAETQENNLREYLAKVGITEDDYEFTYADMMEEVFKGLIKIELKQVTHSKKLTSYAVELYFEDKVVYYTGDQNDHAYLKKVAKKLKQNDIVYTDCTARDYKGRIHVSLDELEQIFDQKQKDQITCMHFDSFASYSEAKSRGFKVASREVSKEELLKQIANRR